MAAPESTECVTRLVSNDAEAARTGLTPCFIFQMADAKRKPSGITRSCCLPYSMVFTNRP